MKELKAWKQFFPKLREQLFNELTFPEYTKCIYKGKLKIFKTGSDTIWVPHFLLTGKQSSVRVLVRIIKLIVLTLLPEITDAILLPLVGPSRVPLSLPFPSCPRCFSAPYSPATHIPLRPSLSGSDTTDCVKCAHCLSASPSAVGFLHPFHFIHWTSQA